MNRLFALTLLAAMAPTQGAAFQTRESLAGGNSYYSQCVAGPKDYSACIGYFMGIADAPVMNMGKTPEEAIYCLPPGASYEQHRDRFHTFLRDNPAIRHISTHHLFLIAMNSAFPCKSSPLLSIDPATNGLYMTAPEPR